jgi:hypothetical protein
MQKSVCQNLITGQSYGPHIKFLPANTCLDFPKYGHILGKTLCSGPKRRPGRQAHRSTALAPLHHDDDDDGFVLSLEENTIA